MAKKRNRCSKCYWGDKCSSKETAGCEYCDIIDEKLEESVTEELIEIRRAEFEEEYEEYIDDWN